MSIHQIKRRAGATDYRVRVTDKGSTGEIFLYGTIGLDWFGDGVSAKQFADDVRKLGNVSRIDLRINSDGGVVTDARAMYNLLVDHKAHIAVHVDGIAASAASFLAMAGDEIDIAEGGYFMIHNARGGVIGGADEMRRMADVLDSMNGTIRKTYADRTKNTDAQLQHWMDAETWFTGPEAVTNGFADRVVANNGVAVASVRDPSVFRNLPAALRPNRAKALSLFKSVK